MTADEIRRAVLAMELPARRALVEQVTCDLALTERVATQADWLSLRLRAALANRWRNT